MSLFRKNIQNEVIQLQANKVKSNILIGLKIAKYYSIVSDCRPDVSDNGKWLKCSSLFGYFNLDYWADMLFYIFYKPNIGLLFSHLSCSVSKYVFENVSYEFTIHNDTVVK